MTKSEPPEWETPDSEQGPEAEFQENSEPEGQSRQEDQDSSASPDALGASKPPPPKNKSDTSHKIKAKPVASPSLRLTTLNSINALGTLLIFLGMTFFNNSMLSWQISQQGLQGPEARQVLMNLALYIIMAAFLMLLGIQLLFKRPWACHFLRSIKQMSQLAMLLIPLSTILILYNRSLMNDLSTFYQEFIQELMQQMEPQAGVSESIDIERIRRILQTSFWLLSFLSMAICGLVLRLSRRSLSPEVQKLLEERNREASPWSQFILRIPGPFLFLLLLSAYGATLNLLTLVFSFAKMQSFLISLLSFGCFALALLRLTHKNIGEQELSQNSTLKNALKYCSLGYGLQLLGVILQFNTNSAAANPGTLNQELDSIDGQATIDALEKAGLQVTALYYIVMLLYFGWLYRKYFTNHEEANSASLQDPPDPEAPQNSQD